MRVSVLGPLLVDEGRVSLPPRDRVVLTALAMQVGEIVEGDRLADALWGDAVPASWNKVVQGCIVRLRKALGPGSIDTRAHGYRLAIAPDDIDVRRFELSLHRARELVLLGEPERVLFAADEALALWRGQPLSDAGEWEPARIEVARLEELRMEAEELQLDAALRAGRHAEVLGTARACVDAAPTRERRWELLALAQYRTGRQADALRTLHTARRVLAEEVGVDPGPDLVALERAVLDQDPALAGPQPPPDIGTWCPWPGLVAYDIGDAEGFFGRTAEIDSCLDRLATDGVVVIVGASGSGKSSLARAGVAARLQRNGCRVRIIVPGSRPLDALTGLPASGETPVLVIDQCEEVVTLCDDPRQRAQFLDAVVDHVWGAPVLVTLRADHLAELSDHAGFAALIERGLFLLGPMGEADLRAAIDGPAGRAGLRVEPGLVDLVVRDVQAEPGALPLLSHALHQTWIRREGRTMTVAAYRETGGIAGAVAQSAERVYADSAVEERSKLRELLLRLVVPAENGDPARVRLPREVVDADPAYEHLVERLVAARLLTSDDQVVELAHEAVARAWPRLREWLHEDVEGVRVLRHLTAAAAGWDAMGRPSSELYRGPRLAQVRSWHDRTTASLTVLEHAFLDASIAVEEAQLRDAQEQVRRERRTNQRLRRLVVAAALLTAVAVLVSGLALGQRQRADDEADVAEARRIAAKALVQQRPDRALLLAVEAVRRWESPETLGNLLSTISRSPNLTSVIEGSGSRLIDLELSADGTRAAATDADGALTVYDVESRTEIANVAAAGGGPYAAPSFAPDGRSIAAAKRSSDFDRYEVHVFDTDDPEAPPTRYRGGEGSVADSAYSPDGDLLVVVPLFAYAEQAENITVWRAGQPERPYLRLTLPDRGNEISPIPDSDPPAWVAFSPDGAHLYASGAGPVAQFDLDTGQVVRQYPGLGALALSPDGRTLAIRAEDGGVELVSTSSGGIPARLPGGDGTVMSAEFLADGQRIATGSTDGTIVVWDAGTGQQIQVLEGHVGPVLELSYSSASDRLHSIGGERAIFGWDPEGSSLARRLVDGAVTTDGVTYALVSPNGDSALISGGLRGLQRIDTASGEIDILEASENFLPLTAAYSPDGHRVVGVHTQGTARLWDMDTGELVATERGRGSLNLGAIAFSPDGRSVLVADADGRVTELDGETLSETGRSVDVDIEPSGLQASVGGSFALTAFGEDPSEGTEIVFGDLDDGPTTRVHLDHLERRGTFSPDGTRYASGGFDGHVTIVDVATGSVGGPSDPVHNDAVEWLAFSPDGETLASLGWDGDLVLADPETANPRARTRPGPSAIRGAFSYLPDGETIVIGFHDGLVVAHDVDPGSWLEHACRVTGRDLTAAEWRDLVGSGAPSRTCAGRS